MESVVASRSVGGGVALLMGRKEETGVVACLSQ
jgi:hypothetical protein